MEFANIELEYIKFQSREKLKTFQCKKNICMHGYRTGMVSFSKKPSAILLPRSCCHASAYVFQEIIESVRKFYYVLRKITVGP